jgi:hypothetical protein
MRNMEIYSNKGRFRRGLVAGWFSFPDRRTTFGDVLAKDVVCRWLQNTGIPFDVAGHPSSQVPGVDMDEVNPARYDLFIFVFGPWRTGRRILNKFQRAYKLGVNLSIKEPDNHGFDAVIPRDMLDTRNPDIVFGAESTSRPLAGILLVHKQPAYGERQRHAHVQSVVDAYLAEKDVFPIYLDTRIENNPHGIGSVSHLESMIAGVDLAISTRLHGMVFALKNETPVVAIDPIAGGAKVTAQAHALKWPLILDGSHLTLAELRDACDRCLSGSMLEIVRHVRDQAVARVHDLEGEFREALAAAW